MLYVNSNAALAILCSARFDAVLLLHVPVTHVGVKTCLPNLVLHAYPADAANNLFGLTPNTSLGCPAYPA